MRTMLFVFILLTMPGDPAGADAGLQLTEVKLFRRCYAHLTGLAVPFNDARIPALQQGSTDAVTECTKMIEKVAINGADPQGRLSTGDDPESLLVFQRLYNVFTGFTQVNSARANVSNFFEDFSSTEDVYDNTVVGLALTENMLNPQRHFSDLFNITRVPQAYREVDPRVVYPFTMGALYQTSNTQSVFSPRSRYGVTFQSGANPDTAPYALFYNNVPYAQNLATISVGELKGISYNSAAQVISIPSQPSITSYGGMPFGFDMNATIFKGIHNSRNYVLANAALALGNVQRPDLLFMHRRLIQTIFKDFLCRDLPVLRDADVISFVSTNANANPFRKATSCLRCHSTMDQAAATYRGLGYISAGNFTPSSLFRYSLHATVSSPVSGFTAETGWPALQDPNYYKRPAAGRLYFRSVNGQLIDVPLASGNDLSTALAATDDVYICQAQRLFQYFTGVRVDLFDPYDPSQSSRMSVMTSKDWEFHNFVFKLGEDFKSHQKLRILIEDILKSPYYQRSDYGTGAL